MPPRPYLLAESTWAEIRDTRFDIALLPWGASEAHNYHLPYGTDSYQCDAVAAASARRASSAGARVMVLPTIPFGVQTGQLDIPFCINMNPSTQAAVLGDVASSLAGQGIPRLVLLNGHGGNDFRQMIRELQPRVDILLLAIDWYRVVDPTAYFERAGDHAGEMETSVMLHTHPELVRPLAEAGDGAQLVPRLAAMRAGWAWSPRPWTRISADTGVGDPSAATAAKGASYLEEVTSRIGTFLAELAITETADLYIDPAEADL